MPIGQHQQVVQVVVVVAVEDAQRVSRDLGVDAISLRTDVDALTREDVLSAKHF